MKINIKLNLSFKKKSPISDFSLPENYLFLPTAEQILSKQNSPEKRWGRENTHLSFLHQLILHGSFHEWIPVTLFKLRPQNLSFVSTVEIFFNTLV